MELRLSTAPPPAPPLAPAAAGDGGAAPPTQPTQPPAREWSCDIRLRYEFDAKGRPLPKVREEAFGPTLWAPGEVEGWVRRAQRAVLNPSRDAASFADGPEHEAAEAAGGDGPPEAASAAASAGYGGFFSSPRSAGGGTAGERSELRFTRNSVILDIRGAPAALSLVDLPGLIATTGAGAAQEVTLVRSLSEAYVGRPNCLIVAVISCETDPDNQPVYALARAADPGGRRTLGVLTKPDLIQECCHGRWLRILRGEEFKLRLGYHVVRSPTKKELAWARGGGGGGGSVGHAAARAVEDAFFGRGGDPVFSTLEEEARHRRAQASAGLGGRRLHSGRHF